MSTGNGQVKPAFHVSVGTVLNIADKRDRPRAAQFLNAVADTMHSSSFLSLEVAIPLSLLVCFPLFDYLKEGTAVGDLFFGGAFALLAALALSTIETIRRLRAITIKTVNHIRIAEYDRAVAWGTAMFAAICAFVNFLACLLYREWLDHHVLEVGSILLVVLTAGVSVLLRERAVFRKWLHELAMELVNP